MRRRALLLLALLAAACGPPGPLLLTIEASLGQAAPRIPDDVDRVQVLLSDTAGAKTVYQRTFDLNPDEHQFPLTLALEPSGRTPAELRAVVTLFRGETARGGSEAAIGLNRGQLNQATVRVVLDR